MKIRWSLHLFLLALCAGLVWLLFLREPGFGDDFTYWSFALDLHEHGLKAWARQSFHDLRWPVWGLCWLIQCFTGPSLIAYYGEPLVYLVAGSLLIFTFARALTGSLGASWTAGLLFLFHPLLDTVCYRPMPDLSEGVWGAAAVLCCWRMLQVEGRSRLLAWTVALGACLYIAESNRLTGVFIIPVVGLITLCWGRRRLWWLFGAGAVAGVLYLGEAAFYHGLFRDWLHNLHANMGGKGKKGTEPIALWWMPFRFLGAFSNGGALAPVLALLSLCGLPLAWRRRSSPVVCEDGPSPLLTPLPLGRVIVLWAVVLYLEYACAPQSLWPWRPLIREADRFLAGVTIPLALLATLSLRWLWERYLRRLALRVGDRFTASSPRAASAARVLGVVLAVTVLSLLSIRSFFSLGYVPAMRAYMRSLPEGTKVFTHDDMRRIAYLVDAASARRLHFLEKSDIITGTPELETLAASASEFWYARKLLWLTTRKKLEKKATPDQPPLPSYFDHTEKDWALARLLAKGDTPDLIFYRRRTPAMPAPQLLAADAPEWGGLIPPLPLEWKARKESRSLRLTWPVPPALRGKLVRLEFEAASTEVQGFMALLQFMHGKKERAEYVLKPYLYPKGGKEFFVLQLPPEAEECRMQLRLSKEGAAVTFSSFHAFLEDGLVQGALE